METIIETIVKPFNKEWWDDFMETTGNLTKTSVLKNCLTKEETTLFRGYVLEIIAELATLRTNKYGYRVYLDGTVLTPDQMEAIYDQPPIAEEALEQWVDRVFKNQKFGIIINKGEKFNLELSHNIALKTANLFERVGFPREGINFTLFIGNYDKTPLGIHQDKKGENVIHFHLGPGNKTMYTWDKEEYVMLAGGKKQNNKNVDALLPYATEFAFEEGDLYFMPQGEYHIGSQDGLSVAITLWQYNHTKEKLIIKLNSMILKEFHQENDDLLFPDRTDIDDLSGLNDILNTIVIPEELAALSYKDLLKEAYKDLRYSVSSNAGYRTSPLPDPNLTFSTGDVFQSEKPYQILYKETIDGTKLHVFIRGIKIELKKFQCIIDLIDAINTGEKFVVNSLFEILDATWPYNVKSYLINLFYSNHGIFKVTS